MYIVEGNIGAGKSTFLKLISTYFPQIAVVFEPMAAWQTDESDQSILRKFYNDPSRWAYTIETLAMVNRVKDHLSEQQKSPLRIMERSIYSGHYCFAHNDYASGFMTELEWNIYNQWFNFLVAGKCKPPLGFIYLKTDPEISFERLKKRGRSSETEISLEYLKQIDEHHKRFLVEKRDILPELKNVPVLILDCNQEFETNQRQLLTHMTKVDNFIKETIIKAPPINMVWHTA